MIDLRELILSRLVTICTGLPGIISTVRSRALLKTEARPAIAVLDGDERSRLTGDRRGRARMSPALVTCTPQIFILLEKRTVGKPEAGPDLNAYRVMLLQILNDDQELVALIGTNGNIAYDGCETDLKSGSAMEGSMRLDFSITYPLIPD